MVKKHILDGTLIDYVSDPALLNQLVRLPRKDPEQIHIVTLGTHKFNIFLEKETEEKVVWKQLVH